MRKLAKVVKVDDLIPIENAAFIEIAKVEGWQCVVKKGTFVIGELVVYIEIDSWVPNSIAPFLSKDKEPKEYNGVKGEKLRTVKLRGCLSQGLLLPIGILPNINYNIGDDVTEILGIQKWEPPIPAQLQGTAKSLFPSFIPKTDQERIQNLSNELNDWVTKELTFEVTEKLDGSSMTVYSFNDDEGVCSRNIDLKETEDNTFWKVCRREKLLDKISGLNIAIQGELIGEGIQGNPYKLKGQDFYLFDIYDISRSEYYSPQERIEFCTSHNIKHVPILDVKKNITHYTIDDILDFAESKSTLNVNTEREGIVFKCNEVPDIHFKSISNKFLLGER